MQSYSNSLLTSSTFRESRKYLIFRVPLPVQSSMNMTIRTLLSYVNGLADTAQAQRHQPSPGQYSPSIRAVEAPSCPTSTCAASTDDLSRASPPSPATQENEAKIPIHANDSSTTATQLRNDEQPPSSNFLAPCMTILAILVGFCCLLQGLYGHFCLDGPRRRRIRSQSASQRVRKRVKFRKRRQTKVYSLANFLSLKLTPTTRTTTQRHAATTQLPVYSVSAYLHGLREAHASLTYGLNCGVEQIADVWCDWRCPCGQVKFRRRQECQTLLFFEDATYCRGLLLVSTAVTTCDECCCTQ